MSWAPNEGWDDTAPPESGGDQSYKLWVFWMPPTNGSNGTTKRIMFISDHPSTCWMHDMYGLTPGKGDREVCPKKNEIEPNCCICDIEKWPSFTGHFGIIDMGDVVVDGDGLRLVGYTSKAGKTYQFGKKVFAAKRGSKDKPGILHKLSMLKKREARCGGSLKGTVWDVVRSGSKAAGCGDEFFFVEKVAEDEWEDYLVGLGAVREELDLTPVNWADELVPKTNERLSRLIRGSTGPSQPVAPSGSGAQNFRSDGDDDLPF